LFGALARLCHWAELIASPRDDAESSPMLGETCLGIILPGEHGELVFMALRTYVFKKAFEPRRWGWQLCDPGYTPRRVRADNVESAPHAHHLQNPQNRPWYRFVTDSLIGPLAGWGEE